MAYKDEYEVARLYSQAAFAETVRRQFGAPRKLSLWLAPPLFSNTDPATGRPRKRKFGPWIWPALRLLAKGKVLRGTLFDPFGRSAERRAERALIETYEADIRRICQTLEAGRCSLAAALADWPSEARGFGPVKRLGMAKALALREQRWAAYAQPPMAMAAE
jgi:indolepyruvate ferredoxin oxidoreductase